jgi:Phage ABA sandwich domain
MGNEKSTELVRIEALAELDVLVARQITGEKPQSHWEDSHAGLHFDTLEEALEALREPYFQQFIPEGERGRTVLREIEEYRCYSTDLDLAWEAVARLGSAKAPLMVWRESDAWHAAFGGFEGVSGETAPIAICLAGLRARGIEVVLPENGLDGANAGLRVASSITNQLVPGLIAD